MGSLALVIFIGCECTVVRTTLMEKRDERQK
jgi:hypothetical protein